MKIISRITFSIYFTIMTFFILNLIMGSCGLIEFYRLKHVKKELTTHVEMLKKINVSLRSDLVLIQEDKSELELRARKLGYYQKNEGVLVIEGGKDENPSNYPGYIKTNDIDAINKSPLLALFSIICGVICFTSSFLVRRSDYARKKRSNRLQESSAQAII